MESQTKRYLIYLILPLLLLNAAVAIAYRQIQPDFLLHADFYDVGQGDAIFLKTYQGHKILIDGGPSDKVLSLLGKELPFFDRKIDLIILTHAHADHVTGLVDVLNRFQVGMVMLPDADFHSAVYDQFLRLIDQKHIQTVYAQAGQRVWLDSGTVFDVFYPHFGKFTGHFQDGFGVTSNSLNDTSIVGRLMFGKEKLLFTGDAGSNIEHELTSSFDVSADLLKVGHHGSRFASSLDFLQAVHPHFAVIEVGKNNYGHPTPETLNNLEAVNAQVFRTDLDHTVKFVSDGSSLYKQ